MKTLRVTLAGVFALLLAGCPPPQSRQPPRPQTQQSPLPQPPPPQQSRQSQAAKAEQKAEAAERQAEAAERAAEEAEATAQDAQAKAQDAESRRAAEAARNQARIARQTADAARRDADAGRQAADRESAGERSSRDSAAAARTSAAARDRSKEAAERAQDANKAAAAESRDGSPGAKDAADAAARGAADARTRAQAARDRAEEARRQAERQRQTASRGQARGNGTPSRQSGQRPGGSKSAADARRAAGAAERRAKSAEDRAEAANRRAREAEERGDIAAARRARIERDRAGREAAQRRSEADAWRQAEAARRGSSGSSGRPSRPPGRVPGGQPGDAWRVSRGDADPRKRLPLPPLPESLGGDGRSFQDCEECPAMTKVRGGSFIMGSPPSEWGRDQSEGPQHRVTIGYEFAVGIYEITKAEYAAFVDETGHRSTGACLVVDGSARLVRDRRHNWRDPGFPQSPRDPVVCVSWRDAQAYARWLSHRTGERYRLLSESEWEYAARGGSDASQFWGDNPDGACDYANGADLSAQSWIRTHLSASRNNAVTRYYLLPLHECQDGYTATAPVGTFYPNAFGLHDMIANVDEWVLDCWNEDYRGAPATGAPWMRGNCSKRVARSGSWINGTRYNRTAHRDRSDPDFRHFTIGFRVAREL